MSRNYVKTGSFVGLIWLCQSKIACRLSVGLYLGLLFAPWDALSYHTWQPTADNEQTIKWRDGSKIRFLNWLTDKHWALANGPKLAHPIGVWWAAIASSIPQTTATAAKLNRYIPSVSYVEHLAFIWPVHLTREGLGLRRERERKMVQKSRFVRPPRKPNRSRHRCRDGRRHSKDFKPLRGVRSNGPSLSQDPSALRRWVNSPTPEPSLEKKISLSPSNGEFDKFRLYCGGFDKLTNPLDISSRRKINWIMCRM